MAYHARQRSANSSSSLRIGREGVTERLCFGGLEGTGGVFLRPRMSLMRGLVGEVGVDIREGDVTLIGDVGVDGGRS